MESFRDKEEFLELVKNQIRCKRARNTVAGEIEQHIEDQKESYIAEGDDEPEAIQKALQQMGNPEEIGKQLDKIHRPHLEWKLLLLVCMLCISGIVFQLSIEKAAKAADIIDTVNIGRQILFMGVGIIFMCLFYFIDYTVIGKYSKALWVLLISLCMILAHTAPVVHGTVRHLPSIVMLFIPLYGGLVYAYRKKGYLGIIKCLIIGIVTCMIEMRYVSQTNVSMGFMLSCLIILSVAVQRDWFGTLKSRSLLLIWGWPFIFLILSYLSGTSIFSSYRMERLRNYLGILSNPANYEHGYQMNMARRFIFPARIFGESPGYKLGYLPSLSTDYILTYIIGRYGIAVGLVLIVMFIVLFARLLRLSLKQKNSLGLFVGLGCSLVFITMGMNYIFANLGFQFLAQVNLPFMSYGGTNIIINFIVLGILLSVVRNTNIIKEKPYIQRYANFMKVR